MDWLDIAWKAVSLLSMAVAIGSVVYAHLTRRSTSNADDIKALGAQIETLKNELTESLSRTRDKTREDLKEHDRRIQSLESEVRHLPTKDQVHGLELAIKDIGISVASLSERVNAIGGTVALIDEYLRTANESGGGDSK